ncbi:MerR family transcriptional regulator [Cryptosporangium sp. NPDC048952]|uniref:MerR family transcriptional regulator n=1 Tax=Cryptosporangium sp. NPDC048952 TaxID=3363961 RepID=UPI0037239DAD
MTTAIESWRGIAEVAELCGLSQDTLRWYEREGLIPQVRRGPDGRRRFSARDTTLLVMLAKLRATGMPTEDMRAFSRMVGEGAASHGRRLALLERHRLRIREQMDALRDASLALESKADHYRSLIDAGLDCDGVPVSADVARAQAEGAA